MYHYLLEAQHLFKLPAWEGWGLNEKNKLSDWNIVTLLMFSVVTVLLLHTAGPDTSNITNSREAFLNVADFIRGIFEYDRREIWVGFFLVQNCFWVIHFYQCWMFVYRRLSICLVCEVAVYGILIYYRVFCFCKGLFVYWEWIGTLQKGIDSFCVFLCLASSVSFSLGKHYTKPLC